MTIPRQSPPIAVEEHPGEAFADLGAAQRAALRPIVVELASALRAMLAAGILEVRDGQIVKANSHVVTVISDVARAAPEASPEAAVLVSTNENGK